MAISSEFLFQTLFSGTTLLISIYTLVLSYYRSCEKDLLVECQGLEEVFNEIVQKDKNQEISIPTNAKKLINEITINLEFLKGFKSINKGINLFLGEWSNIPIILLKRIKFFKIAYRKFISNNILQIFLLTLVTISCITLIMSFFDFYYESIPIISTITLISLIVLLVVLVTTVPLLYIVNKLKI